MKMKFGLRVIIFFALICVVFSTFIKEENREAARSERASPQRRFHYAEDFNYQQTVFQHSDNPKIQVADCPVEICGRKNRFNVRGNQHVSKGKICKRPAGEFNIKLCYDAVRLDSPHGAAPPKIIYTVPKNGRLIRIGRKSAFIEENKQEFAPKPRPTIMGSLFAKFANKADKMGKILKE